MNLKETLELPTGTPYQLEVMVVSAELRDKKAGGKFLCLSVQDISTNLSLNMWAGYGDVSTYAQGSVALISGAVGKPYQDKPQLNLDFVQIIAGSLSEYTGTKTFVPSYPVTSNEIGYICETVQNLSSPWKELATAMFGISNNSDWSWDASPRWTAFLEAPAAKKWHGNKVGGLIHHTIGVVKTVKAILDTYPDATINRDRVIFCALVHDIFKTKDYVWAPVIDYNADTLVDHRHAVISELSIINACLGTPLSYKELQVVLYTLLSHHGDYGENKCKSSEDWILHLADMVDAKIIAGEEGK